MQFDIVIFHYAYNVFKHNPSPNPTICATMNEALSRQVSHTKLKMQKGVRREYKHTEVINIKLQMKLPVAHTKLHVQKHLRRIYKHGDQK